MTPRFSILTPAYNAEATIARTIASVRAQTFSDFEHLIVDDGSTDATVEIARSFAREDERIKVFERPHRGVTATRIDCMALAQGELFARLDADDRMREDYLVRVDDMFRRYPEAQIVSTNGYQVFADGSQVYYYTADVFQRESSLSIEDMLHGYLIGTSAVMTRDVYEMTGGPRPESRSEDIDLWLRALAMGANHRHLPEPVFFYHQDAANRVSDDVEAVWRSHVEILEHLIEAGLLTDSQRSIARKAIARYRVKLVLRWHAWGIPARKAISRVGRV